PGPRLAFGSVVESWQVKALMLLRRQGDGLDPLGSELQGGCVETPLLPPPPRRSPALLLGLGEPVLPLHGADVGGRLPVEGIAREEAEDLRRAGEQTQLGVDDPWVLAPLAERGEPEVPFEPRLVWRVDAGRLHRILRLVAERVRRPVRAVAGALELELEAVVRHHREETIAVRDAQGLQRDGRPEQRPPPAARASGQEQEGGEGDPTEQD